MNLFKRKKQTDYYNIFFVNSSIDNITRFEYLFSSSDIEIITKIIENQFSTKVNRSKKYLNNCKKQINLKEHYFIYNVLKYDYIHIGHRNDYPKSCENTYGFLIEKIKIIENMNSRIYNTDNY